MMNENKNNTTKKTFTITKILSYKNTYLQNLLALGNKALDKTFKLEEHLTIKFEFESSTELKIIMDISAERKNMNFQLLIIFINKADFSKLIEILKNIDIDLYRFIQLRNHYLSTKIYKLNIYDGNIIKEAIDNDIDFLKTIVSSKEFNLDVAKIIFGKFENLDCKCNDVNTVEEIVEIIITKIPIIDLFHPLVPGLLKYHKIIYKQIKKSGLEKRFDIYKKLESEHRSQNCIKRLFKRLVIDNVEIIYEELINYIYYDPIDVVNCMIDSVILYKPLIQCFFALMDKLDDFFIEIFYLSALKKLEEIIPFNNEDNFCTKYTNFLKFFIYFKRISIKPMSDFILKSMNNKVFSHLPLLEMIVLENKTILTKFNDILIHSLSDIFEYGAKSHGMKIDMANRYYLLCKNNRIVKPTFPRLVDYSNLKDLLPEQIKEVTDVKNQNLLIDRFLVEENKDFYTIKNFIYLVRFHERINNIEIYNKLVQMETSVEKELKVLVQSCLSVLKMRRNPKVIMRNEKKKQSSNEYDGQKYNEANKRKNENIQKEDEEILLKRQKIDRIYPMLRLDKIEENNNSAMLPPRFTKVRNDECKTNREYSYQKGQRNDYRFFRDPNNYDSRLNEKHYRNNNRYEGNNRYKNQYTAFNDNRVKEKNYPIRNIYYDRREQYKNTRGENLPIKTTGFDKRSNSTYSNHKTMNKKVKIDDYSKKGRDCENSKY